MVTRRKFLQAAAATPILATALPMRSAQAAEIKWRWGNSFPISHPVNVRGLEACERIKKESGGQISIEIFPDGQLGSANDMLSQVRSGALDMTTNAGLGMAVLVPVAGIINMPFAFKNYDQAWAAVDGDLGKLINAQVEKLGLHAFDKYPDNGYRQITSNKLIKSPDDLKGFKIRVPGSPLNLSLFRALGASPVSMDFNEVYTALQTKVVDGQENPLVLIDQKHFNEVQKYCALSNHLWDALMHVSNLKGWNEMPKNLRDIVARNLDQASVAERADVFKLNSSLQSSLEAKGMVFNKPDADAFRAALSKAGFYAQWQKTYGPEAWATLTKYSGPLA